jgi:2-dehydropantoate 2-reductase
MTSSMHYDITHHKPLEVDWLNGAVVRLAAQDELDVPVNQTIFAGLKLHAAGS